MKKNLCFLLLAFFVFGFSFKIHAQAQIYITTIAGTGTAGNTGDGSAALAATLSKPDAIAVDASGNMYISDWANNCIRMVNTSGVITTIGGNGTPGYLGDGGPAILAEINNPSQICVDSVGNVFFAEYANNVVRKINTLGIISTFAGTGTPGATGDGSLATVAELNNPIGVTFDGLGNMYISEFGNDKIRKVNTLGIISTFAGTGTAGYTGDGVAAISTELNNPDYLTTDALNNVYFCDDANQRVRKINTAGIISTIAGTGTGGFNMDGIPATNARLFYPGKVAIDASGNLYITDYSNQRLRKVNRV